MEWQFEINVVEEWEAMEKDAKREDEVELWRAVAEFIYSIHQHTNNIDKVCGFGVGRELDELLIDAEKAILTNEKFEEWLQSLKDFCESNGIKLCAERG
jgi:hypothetical protein